MKIDFTLNFSDTSLPTDYGTTYIQCSNKKEAIEELAESGEDMEDIVMPIIF